MTFTPCSKPRAPWCALPRSGEEGSSLEQLCTPTAPRQEEMGAWPAHSSVVATCTPHCRAPSCKQGLNVPLLSSLLNPAGGLTKLFPKLLGEGTSVTKEKMDMSHWTLGCACEGFETCCFSQNFSCFHSVYDIRNIFVHECTCLLKVNNWCFVPKECCACFFITERLSV